MASICNQINKNTKKPNGMRTIQFVCNDGKRRSIRLGKVPMKFAESVKTKVEYLIANQSMGLPIDSETAQWLGTIDHSLYERISAVGLVRSRERLVTPRLQDFIESYIDKQKTLKWRSLDILKRSCASLVKYLGPHTELKDITEADAEDWRKWLFANGRHDGGPLAENTVNDRCKKVKQVFNYAIKARHITANPFAGLNGRVRSNKEKKFFITIEATDRLLEASPSQEWRTLIALCRYGGLRHPSETIRLKWCDVNWDLDHGTILVHSKKTEHHRGKATRQVPLFPPLRAEMQSSWEQADDGAEYVLPTWGGVEKNTRKPFQNIIKRAGLKEWPRLFHNLRSSRQTELVSHQQFSVTTVAEWMGNSPEVGNEFYMQLTEQEHTRAVHGAVQQAAASHRNASQSTRGDIEKTHDFQGLANKCDAVQ
jgi:integrase